MAVKTDKDVKEDVRGERRAPIGGTIERRFADFKTESYDAKARTVEAVLSVGAEVKRFYGTEVLSISPAAVNMERLETCGIPLIDSHQTIGISGVFGRLVRAWFDAGQLMGVLAFDDSDVGRKAEGLVSRGTVRGISIGYRVDEWEVTDDEGSVIDPERERMAWDEEYTFTAKRWELLEVSLVSVPADPNAFVRAVDDGIDRQHADLRVGASRVTLQHGNMSISYEYPDRAKDVSAASAAARARMAARLSIASR